MLRKLGKIGLAAAAGSTMLLGSASTIGTVALADEGVDQSTYGEENSLVSAEAATADTLTKVEGTLTFDQTGLSSKDEIRRALYNAANHICGSQFVSYQVTGEETSLDWKIFIGGSAADNQFSASLSDLTKEVGAAKVILGCSCAGNPAGGLGTVNAAVTGVALSSIMEKAGVSEEANTIVFKSSDGYEVALPLTYIKYRHSMIVYEINGGALQDQVGGINQLWLGSTSALYFARDIIGITFESRATPPPTPGTEEANEAYANIPGIGITYSGVRE